MADEEDEQQTGGNQSGSQQTADDESQDQGTTDDQSQDQQTSQDQSQDQGTTADQNQDQQTPQDQSQDQGTTADQSQDQQTPQDQGQGRQTIGDQVGRQTTQPSVAGTKTHSVNSQSAQTQGTGVQPTPQGRLGPGDHVWYYKGQISTNISVPRAAWFPGSNSSDPDDYQGHGREVFQYVIHENGQIFEGQPHMRNLPGTFAWLNNNPGNITAGGANLGEYQGKVNRHNFLIFPTAQIGFEAIGKFLRGPQYRNLSILAALRKYAPPWRAIDPTTTRLK